MKRIYTDLKLKCQYLSVQIRSHPPNPPNPRSKLTRKIMPETAQQKLKKLTAWDTDPALTEAELDELLAAAALEDKAGLHPLHVDWTPTYDLNAAAASAWLIKAGRASSTTETEPDSFYVTSKIFDNCCRMAKIYRARGRMSLSIANIEG